MDKREKFGEGMPLFCWLEVMIVGDLTVFNIELGARHLDKVG